MNLLASLACLPQQYITIAELRQQNKIINFTVPKIINLIEMFQGLRVPNYICIIIEGKVYVKRMMALHCIA